MSEATQKRLFTVLAMAITMGLSRQLSDRFIDLPEQRGIKDDVREAALKAGIGMVATVGASVLVRQVVAWSRR